MRQPVSCCGDPYEGLQVVLAGVNKESMRIQETLARLCTSYPPLSNSLVEYFTFFLLFKVDLLTPPSLIGFVSIRQDVLSVCRVIQCMVARDLVRWKAWLSM